MDIIICAFVRTRQVQIGTDVFNGGIAMIIELEPIFQREGAVFPLAYTFSVEDDVIDSDIRVSGRIFNRTGIVRISATASYSGKTNCARCNKAFSFEVSVPIDHVLLAQAENEDSDLYIVADDLRLDLDALVCEDVFLAMPSRFLCRKDCKGLCPVCGADLNEGDCGCKPAADPRWDALKDLF